MKKKTSPVVVVFGVLALLMLLLWIAVFTVNLYPTSNPSYFGDILRLYFESFWDNLKTFNVSGYYGSIAGWVVIGISGILFVTGIVVGIVKRRASPVLAGVLMLLVALPLVDFVVDLFKEFVDGSLVGSSYLFQIKNGNAGDIAIAVTIIVSACLGYFFGIVYFATACHQPNPEIAKIEETAPENLSLDDSYVALDENTNPDFEEMNAEPVPMFVPEPEPEPEPAPVSEEDDKHEETAPAPAPAPVPAVEEKKDSLDKDSLLALMKEIVRDIVRDEVARATLDEKEPGTTTHTNAHNHTVTGATFGGPLVVQYFNSPMPNAAPEAKPEPKPEPAPQPPVVEKVVQKHIIIERPTPVLVREEPKPEPAPAPAPAPEPVKEEPAPEPVKEVEPVPEPEPVKEEPIPDVVPQPVETAPVPEVEKPKIVRIPFEERITTADQEMKDNYNALKNEILSYGVKSRVSNSGDTFRLHRKTYVKITIAGKSLKLYFALNPEDYKESTIPVQDAGEKNVYSDIPLVFKVKSTLSLRRAKTLIQEVMEKDDLEQGEVGEVDWVNEIKAEMEANKPKD